MAISTTSFPEASAWDAVLQNAMWHWNNVRAMDFRFWVSRDTDNALEVGNGVNEIGAFPMFDDFLAITYTRYHCLDLGIFGWNRAIDEADILFNTIDINTGATIDWSLTPLDYSTFRRPGGPVNFESVALHELGHALGLDHQNGLSATMNTYYPFGGSLGDWREWDPLPDDRQGGRALYTGGDRETDIAASVFKSASDGNSEFVSSPDTALRGSNVTIELTFHNLGTQPAAFNIGFYLSSDDIISGEDLLLGWNDGASAGPGGSMTFARTLSIPSEINAGQYWLGFIVDYNDALSETNENNNAAALPRSITIN